MTVIIMIQILTAVDNQPQDCKLYNNWQSLCNFGQFITLPKTIDTVILCAFLLRDAL